MGGKNSKGELQQIKEDHKNQKRKEKERKQIIREAIKKKKEVTKKLLQSKGAVYWKNNLL